MGKGGHSTDKNAWDGDQSESSSSATPGLINLFANHVRKEAQLAQEKKPSVIKKLHDTKAAELKKPPQKSKEVEL